MLPPSGKLKVRELAVRYTIGPTPLREALSRLAARGLVEQQGQRGFRVPPVTREHLLDTDGRTVRRLGPHDAASLPDILSGMRLGLTVALILSVVGEMLAGQQGLGLCILLADRSFRAPDLFAGVILLGVVGLCSNALLTQAERHLLRWMPGRAGGR